MARVTSPKFRPKFRDNFFAPNFRPQFAGSEVAIIYSDAYILADRMYSDAYITSISIYSDAYITSISIYSDAYITSTVVVTWIEWNNTQTPGTYNGTPITNLNLGNTDGNDIIAPIAPILAGQNSYSKYVKLQFSGSFTTISDAKIWMSSGTFRFGEDIIFSGSIGMLPPSTIDISIAQPDIISITTSLPSIPNVILSNNTTAGQLPRALDISSSPGYYSGSRSNLMVFQAQTHVDSPTGTTGIKTISITYNKQ